MKARYRILIAVAALLLLIAGGVTWIATTEGGARTAAKIAVSALDGRLSIGGVEGTVSGPLTLHTVHWRDADAGVDASIDTVTVSVHLPELLARRAHVLLFATRGVRVALTEPLKKDDENKPFSLTPPIEVLLDSASLDALIVLKDGQTLASIKHAEAAGTWTHKGVAIGKLLVDADEGHVNLHGAVHEDKGYVGDAAGTFDWRVGDQTIAGRIEAASAAQKLQATVDLSSPLIAQIEATLGETTALPWNVRVQVPNFDPRKSVLKDGSIKALDARLEGTGDLKSATVRGEIGINGERARIDPLQVAWNGSLLTIADIKLSRAGAPGELEASGTVDFGPKPFLADLKARWTTIELPRSWVGQPLQTRGDVAAHGNINTFSVKGAVQLGPPGKLADLTLDIEGTPEQIDIRQASVVQKTGHLAASGSIKLKPAIDWQISADAQTFDPGAFFVDWPGRLGFTLQTKGRLIDQKPIGTLALGNLSGSLRNRKIAGSANLSFETGGVIAGNLDLASGYSSIHVTGEHGKTLDAAAKFDIASLDDWLPASRGTVSGTVHVTGTWPAIDVSANLAGGQLVYGGTSVGAATIVASVHDLQHASGTIQTKLLDVTADDFHFTTVTLDAEGNQGAHTAHLKADGDPLSAEVRLQGMLAPRPLAWSGTVTQLTVAQKNIATLSLQQPMQLHFSDPELSISESCMAGDGMSICFGANRDAHRETKGSYTIAHLPLSLVVALAAPDLPFKVDGTIEGHGDVRQTPDGALFGTAELTSESGEIREADEQAASLLKYQGFRLSAELSGATATGSAQAQIGADGSLEGHVSLAGLTSAAPTIDANGKLSIPDLTPVSLFVPQLANVHGKGEGTVSAVGPLHAPQITGQGKLADLAAEIPKIGLKLHDGEFTGSLGERSAIDLNGHISSGKGTVTVAGASGADGLKLKLSGSDFLASDIPGARVIVAPDLNFARTSARMDLTGTVTIPEASIDLTKLPQGRQTRTASPDVVVVDDKNAGEAKSTPLYASVTIILTENEKVKLVGLGLDSILSGQLAVQEQPGQGATGSGEIRVSGTYKAYGQNLTIQDGRLLYANQLLTNPQVILTAARVIGDTTAKLTVTGTALRPQLAVSADPAMSETQALSYLVTGKPVDQLGSGEGNAVQSAARSVGGAAGNLLAKNIGKRLGIDTIGVEDSDEIGGSAFTIGQYLSPKLYVSYGVGLFEPGQVITLKYRLSQHFSVEAAQGPLNQRAGINYKVER